MSKGRIAAAIVFGVLFFAGIFIPRLVLNPDLARPYSQIASGFVLALFSITDVAITRTPSTAATIRRRVASASPLLIGMGVGLCMMGASVLANIVWLQTASLPLMLGGIALSVVVYALVQPHGDARR